ncbi:MAG: sensor histidine kinase, partial [Ferruginibacter sp.]
MLSRKNLSPQQLAASTALALSIPITMAILFFEPVWWVVMISFVIIFLGSFGLILYTLQTFI